MPKTKKQATLKWVVGSLGTTCLWVAESLISVNLCGNFQIILILIIQIKKYNNEKLYKIFQTDNAMLAGDDIALPLTRVGTHARGRRTIFVYTLKYLAPYTLYTTLHYIYVRFLYSLNSCVCICFLYIVHFVSSFLVSSTFCLINKFSIY